MNNIFKDLSREDIEFLCAVRDINTDPDAYTATTSSKVPANKTSIREATTLTPTQVEYRLKDRGLDEQLGLIRIHEAPVHNGVFGPKSAELTDRGLDALSRLENTGDIDNYSSLTAIRETISDLQSSVEDLEARNSENVNEPLRTEVEELGNRVDNLSNKTESIADDVKSVQQSVDKLEGSIQVKPTDSKSENLENAVRMSLISASIFQQVFDIDSDDLVQVWNNEELPDEIIEKVADELDISLESSESPNRKRRDGTVDSDTTSEDDTVLWPPQS